MTLISANSTQPRRLTANPFPRHVPVQATGAAELSRTTGRAATLKVVAAATRQAEEVIVLTGPDSTPAGLPAAAPAQAGPVPAEPRPRRQRGLPAEPVLALPWALLAAVAGGLALTAAFPPVGVWPLAPLGPALLVVALQGRSLRVSVLAGLLFGLALFVPLLSWLINLAWYAWAALAIAEAVIFALLCAGQRVLLSLRAWPVGVAGWWVAAEALRGRWPYAFPWGRLAMSQAGTPAAPWAAVGGAPLLTFLLALTGSTLAWLVLRRRIVPALAFAGALGLTLAGALLPADPVPPGTPVATVAAVQGDVPHARNLPNLLRASTVTQNQVAATERLATQVKAGLKPAPDVVIWPENATDLDPRFYPPVFGTIAAAVRAIGRPVLVGEVLQDPQRNVGQLWTPARGPGPLYVKRQLVPFGEYIPFRGLLSHITSLVALQPHDFTAGRRPVVFHVGQIRLGDVICYEVGFDGLVSSEIRAGANLLTVQTNDATFEVDGQRGESLQQLAMARIRAVETDRAVVVASTTGVSAIIAPAGTLVAHTGTWQRAVLESRVPLLSTTTLAIRLGGWPEFLITALTLAAFAWAVSRRAVAARRRRSAPA